MAKLIDGKKISQEIKDELKNKVETLREQGIEGLWLSFRWAAIRLHPFMCEIKSGHASISASVPRVMSFLRKPGRKNC